MCVCVCACAASQRCNLHASVLTATAAVVFGVALPAAIVATVALAVVGGTRRLVPIVNIGTAVSQPTC